MGGDGGVIASNRRYMRGVGTANHTGDFHHHHHHHRHPAAGSASSAAGATATTTTITSDDQEHWRQHVTRDMHTCALSNQPLFTVPARPNKNRQDHSTTDQHDNNDDDNHDTNQNDNDTNQVISVFCCPYGRLYRKEAALEALLQRKQQQNNNNKNNNKKNHQQEQQEPREDDRLGEHIRSRKDLYEARFQTSIIHNDNHNNKSNHKNNDNQQPVKVVPICPITGKELNGLIPALLILLPQEETTHQANVISEKAWTDPQVRDVLREWFPSLPTSTAVASSSSSAAAAAAAEQVQTIRILPPPALLTQIKKTLQQQRKKEQQAKLYKKKEKKAKTKKVKQIDHAHDDAHSPSKKARGVY